MELIIDLEVLSLPFGHQVSSQCVSQTYGVCSVMQSTGGVFGGVGGILPWAPGFQVG